ncbi:hypothetical protein VT84_24615 [Gemmata sp. SH-PL17]|uniref:hypothetical protein n=1 Tax=Gemmata sp. SH-PL17 TaxID=1630693 RepID=UPI0004B26F29|nr:hypothetical protein [Gemmata sp. SH-PL17]AMV27608.1 hypothetical protein VT84_24615 [Gemmata sp. SH-PL17]
MVMKSVHHDCIEEENKYRWLESEKAGYDLGEGCVKRWVKDHWMGYLRARWVEHLQGKCFWIELAGRDFGLLLREFQNQTELLDVILNQLKSGAENLDVLNWAIANNIPTGPVSEILEALDINSKRLSHRFDGSSPSTFAA